MTNSEKMSALKTIIFGSVTDDSSVDSELTVYLNLTAKEILTFKYKMIGGVPDGVTEVPPEDEMTQIMACAEGYSRKGALGEISHDENGINRTWRQEDMVAYVRTHVIAYAGVR